MTANAETQRVANVEGTRHMVGFAEEVEAGRVHMVSSIAAAGLYKGTWREDMFEEAQDVDNHPYFQTKHESEGVVRNECTRPWRVYRPGIVVGNSETGEMDKVDGPYYFFKLIRRIRGAVPQWLPVPSLQGREINIVPVDFVVRAMDHIAHTEGLDGKAFHLTDPNPRTAGEVIDIFARAAHAPQSSVRLPPDAVELVEPLVKLGLSATPLSDAVVDRVLADFGIPRSVLVYVNYPTHFDSRQTQAVLEGTGISVPPLEAYAGKLWHDAVLLVALAHDRKGAPRRAVVGHGRGVEPAAIGELVEVRAGTHVAGEAVDVERGAQGAAAGKEEGRGERAAKAGVHGKVRCLACDRF